MIALLALMLAADPSVGLPARLDGVVLPGPELEAKPARERAAAVVVRIRDVAPHGTSFRYDFEWYGLTPGKYDLRDYLQRKDGSPAAGLPPISVNVVSVLPPGHALPHDPPSRRVGWFGRYGFVVIAGGVVWLIGLLAILFVGRKRRVKVVPATPPPTLADRLRPLVEAARAGTLSVGQQAELERALLGFWRKRLNLLTANPAEAMEALRAHAEAGELVRQLEVWLHMPPTAPKPAVDVERLLAPYRTPEIAA